MTNYDKIKTACQAANPRLLELTAGCMLKRNFHMPFLGEELIFFVDKDEFGRFKGITDKKYCVFELKECEILGHEPTLQDILLAINNKEAEKRNSGEVFHRILIDAEGWVIRNKPEISAYLRIGKIDLSKPVKDQSPEVLQFIVDLL